MESLTPRELSNRESTPQDLIPQKHYVEKLPKLSIEMNTRTHLRINPSSQSSRTLSGEFLGMSHYEFMIFRIPSLPGLRNQLLPQTLVEIRFLYEGAINVFMTEILSHTVKPSFMLFTSYPDRLAITEVRKNKRLNCALPVIINTTFGDANGLISDVSACGCKVTFELTGQSSLRQLSVGSEVVLQIVFSPEGFPVGTSAIVKNLETSGSKVILGLSFESPIKDFSDAINEYLLTIKSLS